ncbi:MAG: M15 family metallopeptidase [Gammaproteobacteria bacterium]|nr:M15 family metallopeptidase [Gammaproteobacteria bacterium]
MNKFNTPSQELVRSGNSCYGERATDQAKLIFPYPMKLAWEPSTIVKTTYCHRLVLKELETIFAETLKHYGSAEVNRLGLNLFGGCFNNRVMRGTKEKDEQWSMHSWAIAVDLDPSHNKLRWDNTKARFAKPEYDAFWKIVEANGFISLGRKYNYDWMHIEATSGKE